MSPSTKRQAKSGSSMSKKPKLYDTGSGSAGSSTMMALWPKRSKKISPGCMVATPMRGAACSGAASASSVASSRSRVAARCGRGFTGACAAGPADAMCAPASRFPHIAPIAPPALGGIVVAMHAHVQGMQAPCIGACDAESETAQGQFLAGLGQVPDLGRDQAADGVVLVVVEVRAEALVEIGDRGQRIDHVLAVGLRGDQRLWILGIVVLVVDLADDFLQHVLDRHEAGDAAVLVDHDRHV